MACCSEIGRNKGVRFHSGILDYIFKISFVIISMPVIVFSFPFKFILAAADRLFSVLVYFSRSFLKDVFDGILSLNSMKLNCRISAYLYGVSPSLAGFTYRIFGYVLIFCVSLILLLGGYYLWPLLSALLGKIFHY